jgi:hypothetical protein
MTLSASTIAIYDKLDELKAARENSLAFVAHVMRDEEDRRIPIDDYTRIFFDIADKCYSTGRHLNHIAPPGLGKSTLARAFALKELGKKPTLREVIVGADKENATDGVSLCRAIIVSPDFQATYPAAVPDSDRTEEKRDDIRGWKTSRLFLRAAGQRKDPSLSARAAEMIGEDIRVDLGIFDDLITPGIVESHARLIRIKKRFHKTWLEGRMANGGWALLIHNCQRNDDLAHDLRANRKFCSWWYGVTKDCERAFMRIWNPPNGLAIIDHPDDFSAEVINPNDDASFECELPLPNRPSMKPDNLRDKDAETRNQLYHLIPMTPDDLMFPAFLTRTKRNVSVAEMLGVKQDPQTRLPIFDAHANQRFVTAVGIDISSTTRPGSVIFLTARDPGGKLYPVYVKAGKFTTENYVETLDYIWTVMKVRFSAVVVESNAVQSQIVEDIRTIARLKGGCQWLHLVVPFTTGANKVNPELGLPSINTRMSNDAIWFPELEAGRDKTWMMFFDDLSNCPRFLVPGKTPDKIMGFWFGANWLTSSAGIAPKFNAFGVRPDLGTKNY